MSTTYAAALAYKEPPISVVLVQTSFLLLLNVLNWALDALLYCGLVGQILVGMAWGTPGAGILSLDAEHFVVQIGYLGLILLVYEGGLSTAFPSLRANIALSAGVAATGIAAPIGLSFVLLRLVASNDTSASSLAAFAAGAALCSTSLGTAFTVLRTSGLAATRLGVVLAGAAMLDDVVGLVMVQVIASLGPRSEGKTNVSATTVVRPVLVSVAFVVVAVLLCRFVVQPATTALNGWRSAHEDTRPSWLLRQSETALVLHTALLVAMVAGASYAGTSNLFAAYVAGAVISWWDSEVPHCSNDAVTDDHGLARDKDASGISTTTKDSTPRTSGCDIFDHYYRPAAKWVLQPFFFASIGFSIPVTKMFAGETVWKGIVYAVLMCVGKLVCGLWLVRFPRATGAREAGNNRQEGPTGTKQASTSAAKVGHEDGNGVDLHAPRHPASLQENSKRSKTVPNPPKPLSIYPAAILGVAMVPRGEIGFLIAAVAQSHGVFGEETDSGVFLVVTWAIVLCTLLGPPCVGLLVRRVSRLEEQAAGRDVLGVWGVRSDHRHMSLAIE